MNFDPRRLRGGAKRFDTVTAAAVRADDALFFGFGQDIHHAAVAIGPVALGEAVHEADVDVIDAEFAAKAIEIGTSGGRVTGPGFGEDGDFVTGDVFEGFGDMGVAAVRISGVEEAQAVVVAIEKQVAKTLYAEGGLVRMVAGAGGAGAHGEAAGLDAGLAKGDGVRGTELAGKRRESEGAACEGGSVKRDGSGSASGAMDKIAAFHGASFWGPWRWLVHYMDVRE